MAPAYCVQTDSHSLSNKCLLYPSCLGLNGAWSRIVVSDSVGLTCCNKSTLTVTESHSSVWAHISNCYLEETLWRFRQRNGTLWKTLTGILTYYRITERHSGAGVAFSLHRYRFSGLNLSISAWGFLPVGGLATLNCAKGWTSVWMVLFDGLASHPVCIFTKCSHRLLNHHDPAHDKAFTEDE